MTDILNADHLEQVEAEAFARIANGENVPTAVLTLAEAVERLRRIRYHTERIADIRAQAEEMMAPLKAELQSIQMWADDFIEDRQKSIAFHNAALTAFYMANRPTGKVKSLKLPGGVIECEDQQMQYNYGDKKAEAKLALMLQEMKLEQFYRTPAPELEKKELKKALVEQDGQMLLNVGDGELIPLEGVTAFKPPEKITIKLAVVKP